MVIDEWATSATADDTDVINVASKDDRTIQIMREIESLGYGTPEYHEAMWFLLSIMARRQYAIADRLRVDQRRRKRAAATRAARKAEANA